MARRNSKFGQDVLDVRRISELGTRLDEVLAVVQHKQHLTARQVGHEHVEQRSIRPLAHAKHRRDRLQD
jgi:hypothetical protein